MGRKWVRSGLFAGRRCWMDDGEVTLNIAKQSVFVCLFVFNFPAVAADSGVHRGRPPLPQKRGNVQWSGSRVASEYQNSTTEQTQQLQP